MKSPIIKHAIQIASRKTSISLEPSFWDAFKDIAESKDMTANALIAEIDEARDGNLSSAIRLFVISYYREFGRNGD